MRTDRKPVVVSPVQHTLDIVTTQDGAARVAGFIVKRWPDGHDLGHEVLCLLRSEDPGCWRHGWSKSKRSNPLVFRTKREARKHAQDWNGWICPLVAVDGEAQ